MSDTTPDVPNPDELQAPEWSWPEEWAGVDDDLPSVLTDPIKRRLTATQERHERELAEARQASLPEEWAPLIQQAQTDQVSPADFRDAMEFAATQRRLLAEDPYAFVYGMEEQIDRLVENGTLTVAQGRTAKRQHAANVEAAGDTEDLRTEDQIRLDALQAWREEQEERTRQEQEQRELELEEQEIEAASTAKADEFIAYFDATLKATGLDGASQKTRQAVADVAMGYMARDEDMTAKAAIDGAMNLFKDEVAARRSSQTPRFPIGGSPSGAVEQPVRADMSTAERKAAMIAAAQAAANS